MNFNYINWETQYVEMQSKKNKITFLSTTLYEKYKVDFAKLQSLEELTGTTTDDGCNHYIDNETRIVYLWNFIENVWEIQ